MGDSLAAKAPLLAYNHFVEAIFVLNNRHTASSSSVLHSQPMAVPINTNPQSLKAQEAAPSQAYPSGEMNHSSKETDAPGFWYCRREFHLEGSCEQMRAKREQIYSTLLRKMTADHKFCLQGKLVKEVMVYCLYWASYPACNCESLAPEPTCCLPP